MLNANCGEKMYERVYVVAFDLTADVRKSIGESTRRSFYEFLRYRSIYTPIGWVILDKEKAEEVEGYCRRINNLARKEVCRVYNIMVPRDVLNTWINQNIRKLKTEVSEAKDSIKKKRTEKKLKELMNLKI